MNRTKRVATSLLLLLLGSPLRGTEDAEKKHEQQKEKAPVTSSSPVMVIVAYRPRPGKEAALLALTREHLPILREQGLATERRSHAMRAADGTIVEVFEWKSKAAIDSAHTNPVVARMWERYAQACDYVPLKDLKESGDLFASFEPIEAIDP